MTVQLRMCSTVSLGVDELQAGVFEQPDVSRQFPQSGGYCSWLCCSALVRLAFSCGRLAWA